MLSITDSRLHTFHDAKSFIFYVCNREDNRYAGRFVVLLFNLWRSRNKVVWQDSRDDATSIGAQAFHNWQGWFLAKDERNINVGTSVTNKLNPSLYNQVKCNVDAGFNNTCGTTNRC